MHLLKVKFIAMIILGVASVWCMVSVSAIIKGVYINC